MGMNLSKLNFIVLINIFILSDTEEHVSYFETFSNAVQSFPPLQSQLTISTNLTEHFWQLLLVQKAGGSQGCQLSCS